MFGAVGAAMFWAAGKALAADKAQLSCVTFQTLSEDVKNSSVWKRIKETDEVIVIPKDAVTDLKFSWLSGIKVVAGEQAFRLCVGPFGISGARRKFRDQGWEA